MPEKIANLEKSFNFFVCTSNKSFNLICLVGVCEKKIREISNRRNSCNQQNWMNLSEPPQYTKRLTNLNSKLLADVYTHRNRQFFRKLLSIS